MTKALITITLISSESQSVLAQNSDDGPNLFSGGDMSEYTEQANPWGGVDIDGNLHGLSAQQIAVDEDGSIRGMEMSPSVAVGDLNGDGLLDLVVADPKGFFWYYPNCGTKSQPKFGSGEVMPIWLGSKPVPSGEDPPANDQGPALDHLVPRIQLIDFDGDGKLDIVAGTFPGKLFFIRNMGSATQPRFETPRDLSELQTVSTRSDGRLDSNYFSPFLYDWFGDGVLQLIKGDGTYSANSVFLFKNKGSNSSPTFNEDLQIRIIPGLGREHLTPQVIDWNNDGKPDIICGERTGAIDLFLNTSPDSTHITFDNGQHVKLGSQQSFGQFTTVTPCSLTGNPKVPDLLYTNNTGEIFLAHNNGIPGAPKFDATPLPLKGVNPFPKIFVPSRWALGWWDSFAQYTLHGWSEGPPYGVPYELLVVTNAAKEPGFTPPRGVNWKSALRYELLPHTSLYFPTSYYPLHEEDGQNHSIHSTSSTSMTSETNYNFSFWVKGEGIHDVSYKFAGGQYAHPGTDDRTLNWISMSNPINFSDGWSQVTDTLSWNTTNGKPHDAAGFGLEIEFLGQGNLYVADVELHKAN